MANRSLDLLFLFPAALFISNCHSSKHVSDASVEAFIHEAGIAIQPIDSKTIAIDGGFVSPQIVAIDTAESTDEPVATAETLGAGTEPDLAIATDLALDIGEQDTGGQEAPIGADVPTPIMDTDTESGIDLACAACDSDGSPLGGSTGSGGMTGSGGTSGAGATTTSSGEGGATGSGGQGGGPGQGGTAGSETGGTTQANGGAGGAGGVISMGGNIGVGGSIPTGGADAGIDSSDGSAAAETPGPDTADTGVDVADAPSNLPDATIIKWISRELLGRPTDHSIVVQAIAADAVEAYAEYGTTSGTYIGSTSQATYTNGIVELTVDSLNADTLYYYRMRYRAAGSSAAFFAGTEYTFNTKRAGSKAFIFAVQSDSHLGYPGFNDPALYQLTMQNIASAKPDFLLDLGDAVSLDDNNESETTVRTKYLNQRAYFEVPGHASAVFLVLGNHEREEGWRLDDFGSSIANSLPVLSANGRKRYFVNPVPSDFYTGNQDPQPNLDGDHLRGDYYAFEWGSALFVAIDPYWYTMKKPYAGALGGEKDAPNEPVGTRWDWTLGQTQYLWLKHTLEGSTAPLKFVFAHHMSGGIDDYGRGGALGAKYCEFGGYNTDGSSWGWDSNRQGWSSPIHQLFVQNHVTAFFHGHDHVYAKEVLGGVVYQEVPMPANASYDTGFPSNQVQYAGATMIANSGYLRVTVGDTNATVDYVRSFLSAQDGTNNSVAASYTLTGHKSAKSVPNRRASDR
jgi:Calcineurin-like phosphoesterase